MWNQEIWLIFDAIAEKKYYGEKTSGHDLCSCECVKRVFIYKNLLTKKIPIFSTMKYIEYYGNFTTFTYLQGQQSDERSKAVCS